MGGNRRRSTRLIAAGAFIAAFAGSAALATGQLSPQSSSVKIAPQGNGATSASCPNGSEAVSGGFASPGFDPTAVGAANVSFVSRRVHGSKWKVVGHNFGGAKGDLTSYVYCDTHEPGLDTVSKSTTILSGSNGSATAKCPRGTEAVSGGFESPNGGPDGDTLFAYLSKRVGDRGWKVAVVSNDPNNDLKLKVFANCDKRKPGLTARSKNGTVAAAAKTSLTPKCPNGRQAVSGGYESTIDTSGGPDVAFAFASRRKSTSSWKVSAFGNAGSITPATETAFVYCKT